MSADEAQRSRVVLGGTAAHLPSALNTALPKEMDLQVTMSSARKQIENSPTNQPNTCNPATDALRAGVLLHEYGDQSTYYFHHLHKQRQQATVISRLQQHQDSPVADLCSVDGRQQADSIIVNFFSADSPTCPAACHGVHVTSGMHIWAL